MLPRVIVKVQKQQRVTPRDAASIKWKEKNISYHLMLAKYSLLDVAFNTVTILKKNLF